MARLAESSKTGARGPGPAPGRIPVFPGKFPGKSLPEKFRVLILDVDLSSNIFSFLISRSYLPLGGALDFLGG